MPASGSRGSHVGVLLGSSRSCSCTPPTCPKCTCSGHRLGAPSRGASARSPRPLTPSRACASSSSPPGGLATVLRRSSTTFIGLPEGPNRAVGTLVWWGGRSSADLRSPRRSISTYPTRRRNALRPVHSPLASRVQTDWLVRAGRSITMPGVGVSGSRTSTRPAHRWACNKSSAARVLAGIASTSAGTRFLPIRVLRVRQGRTLLRCINLQSRSRLPDRVSGVEVPPPRKRRLNALRGGLGIVFQSFTLFRT